MKIARLKQAAIPKMAVLATGLAVVILVATIHPLPAQAFPSKAQDCTNCHGVGVSGMVTATPSTATPVVGTAYTVAITVPAGAGDTGYWIANSDVAGTTGTTTGVRGGYAGTSAPSYSAAMTAPTTAGTYYYKVWAETGPNDETGVTNFDLYSITVGPAASVPTASFTPSVASGTAPLAVTMTDTSTGTPTSWAWNFGNGQTSTVQNPSVDFTAPGAYAVSLTATNASGASTPVSATITVTATTPAPTATFTASPSTGTAPLLVALTDTSVGSPTSWLWTFGDGRTSTLQSPSVTYPAAGTYTVSLTATNASGASTPVSKIITAAADTVAPGRVRFLSATPTSTSIQLAWANPADADFAGVMIRRQLGASAPQTFRDGTLVTDTKDLATTSYTDAGLFADTQYTYAVFAHDEVPNYATGMARSATTLNLPAPAPTASFTASATSGTSPLTVALNDTSVGSPTSWAWTFGDGTTSTEQNPSVTYTVAGTYTVTLTASNASGASTPATQVITVVAPAPAPTASFTASATSGTSPLTVALNDTSVGSPTSWAWTFGDGTTSTEQNPSVTYAAAGTYTVTLIATNASGASTAVTKTVTVATAPAPSTAKITKLSASDGASGDQVTIYGTGFGTAGVVKFGTVTAYVSYWSSTKIIVKVPREGRFSRVPVTVTPANGAASNVLTFSYKGDDDHHDDD